MTAFERGLGERWFDLVWNQLRRDAVAEMLAPQGVLHEAGADSVGPEGFYPFFERMTATFSELHVNVEDTLAEGDKLCVRWSCKAKHTGPGLGFAPTGNSIHVTGMSIFRIHNQQIIEAWQNWDMLAMMTQIKGESKSATYVAVA